MGELQETYESMEVNITLKNLRTGMKLKRIPVFTKEKLTTPSSTARLSPADNKFIKKKKLSIAQKSLLSMKTSPDIVIGQDLINLVILDEAPIMRLPSGLILTPSIFGYTLSGASGTGNVTDGSQGIQRNPFVAAEARSSSKGNYIASKQQSKPELQDVDVAFDLSWIVLPVQNSRPRLEVSTNYMQFNDRMKQRSRMAKKRRN
ncbi:unnamed protein product [Heligmosomoides polygyrus]|uniref:DUF1758 domain-containing protein n=1 Tax=Heligmosomoides polygyrus TaxID=6339 RepID=A0A183G3Y4_HELPZ|nr:unnamed protein product [Heligmosomoides polygyrus]